MNNNSEETHKSNVAGVSQEIFITLPADDQAFLSTLDKMGADLETLYKKATYGEQKCASAGQGAKKR